MKNFLLDMILFALFVAELSFQFLPKVLHEIFGVALAAAIVLHLAINRRRVVSLTKKLSPRKIFSVAVDFALTVGVMIVCASGVIMSNYIFVELVNFELRRNMTIHQLHLAAPYVMMILLGVHVGLHWQELRQRTLNFFGLEKFYRRRQKIFLAVLVLLSMVGVAGLHLNRVVDRILMKHIFGTPATELPAVLFALMIVGGVMLFALITRLLDKKFSA